MLNNQSKITNSLKITACSGGIYKSHSCSWFERFHLTSQRAKNLLSQGGYEVVLHWLAAHGIKHLSTLVLLITSINLLIQIAITDITDNLINQITVSFLAAIVVVLVVKYLEWRDE